VIIHGRERQCRNAALQFAKRGARVCWQQPQGSDGIDFVRRLARMKRSTERAAKSRPLLELRLRRQSTLSSPSRRKGADALSRHAAEGWRVAISERSEPEPKNAAAEDESHTTLCRESGSRAIGPRDRGKLICSSDAMCLDLARAANAHRRIARVTFSEDRPAQSAELSSN